MTPSHLTFTPVPARFHGKSYIQLFQHLITKEMAIPLGLYRSSPWGVARGDKLPYVITNPTADLLCQADDFVYTLDSKVCFSCMHVRVCACVCDAEANIVGGGHHARGQGVAGTEPWGIGCIGHPRVCVQDRGQRCLSHLQFHDRCTQLVMDDPGLVSPTS